MELSIQPVHVVLQVSQVAFKVRDLVNMARKSIDLVRVCDQMTVLASVAIMNRFFYQSLCCSLDLHCELINVTVFVGVALSRESGHDK